MMMVVCLFLCCAVEGGSQQVMLEGMLLPLFPVPLLNGDAQARFKWDDRVPPFLTECVLKKTQSENVVKS